ncbi:MAG TPA: hypothetical protein VGL83_05550 [Stellaceae bacterium]|jgi:hypothetical protein
MKPAVFWKLAVVRPVAPNVPLLVPKPFDRPEDCVSQKLAEMVRVFRPTSPPRRVLPLLAVTWPAL